MSLTIQVESETYDQFESGSVTISMDSLCRSFIFTAASDGNTYLPFKGGEECKIFVDGELVLSGNIEVVNVSYSDNEHIIEVEGRDYTGDILDSTLDNIPSIAGAGLTLKSIIEKVLDHLNIGVSVIDNVSPAPFNGAEDISSPQPGENAFEFLERYSRKRQVLLNSNGDGDIVISQSQGQISSSSIRHEIDGLSNNVIRASAIYDRTGRYNVYKFSSSLNPIALNLSGAVSTGDIASQRSAVITDDEVPAGRQLVMISETSASSLQNSDRARWERNIRRSRGKAYQPVVSGFRGQDGTLWTPGAVVSVVDDRAAINGQMLINSVTYDFSLDEGRQTTIGMLPPDAYTLDLVTPVYGDVGNELSS